MARPSEFDDSPPRRLSIEQNESVAKDGFGQPVENWVSIIPTADGCVWATIAETGGREFFNGVQVQADVDTRILLRSYAGKRITPDMRGVEAKGTANEVIYHFRSVRFVDDERSAIEIMACKLAANPRP
jgi:head-tail adaptor